MLVLHGAVVNNSEHDNNTVTNALIDSRNYKAPSYPSLQQKTGKTKKEREWNF